MIKSTQFSADPVENSVLRASITTSAGQTLVWCLATLASMTSSIVLVFIGQECFQVNLLLCSKCSLLRPMISAAKMFPTSSGRLSGSAENMSVKTTETELQGTPGSAAASVSAPVLASASAWSSDAWSTFGRVAAVPNCPAAAASRWRRVARSNPTSARDSTRSCPRPPPVWPSDGPSRTGTGCFRRSPGCCPTKFRFDSSSACVGLRRRRREENFSGWPATFETRPSNEIWVWNFVKLLN